MELTQSISLETVVVAAKDQVSSDLGGETAILNLKNGTYYGLDFVGTYIWEMIQEPKRVIEIRDNILTDFEVDVDRCELDLLALLSQLQEQQLINITDETHP